MTRVSWWGFVMVDFLVIIVGLGFLLKINIDKRMAGKYEDRNVPVLDLKLNGVSLSEIDGGDKETKYGGNELTIYNSGVANGFENVEVKGRGNGTWLQEKKPYQIKFQNKVDVLGLGKARKWVLLANYLDATNLRTEAAFWLGDALGMEYNYHGRFVELFVDGEYRGLYYLTHAMEVGKNMVGLKNNIGVLVELDNIYGMLETNYVSGDGDLFVVKDTVSEENESVAMGGFMESYNAFEIAVKERNFEAASALADLESFAKYFLVSEISVNPDAYWTSFYFYKDGASDKIHAGPVWDFDLAWGNRFWGNWMGESFYSPRLTMVRKGEMLSKEEYEAMGNPQGYESSQRISKIMFELMEMPEFRKLVVGIYREKLSGKLDVLLGLLEDRAKDIEVAVKNDEIKWNKNDFKTEFELLKDWIRERYDYFEETYVAAENETIECDFEVDGLCGMIKIGEL